MTAKELRLGNYVEYNGMYLQVSEIYSPKPRLPKKFDGVECVELVCDGFITAVMTDIKPIPLTEDILLKCGFEIRKDGKLSHYELSLHEADFIFNSKSDIVQYLHQLQNLYFALSGQELKVVRL